MFKKRLPNEHFVHLSTGPLKSGRLDFSGGISHELHIQVILLTVPNCMIINDRSNNVLVLFLSIQIWMGTL